MKTKKSKKKTYVKKIIKNSLAYWARIKKVCDKEKLKK